MNYNQFQWAASPVLHLLLISTGLILCLFLFITLKRDIFRLDRRTKAAHAALSCNINQRSQVLTATMEKQNHSLIEIQKELKVVSDRVNLLSPSAAPASGINLVKRTQVLQMARRGNRPDQIAACLQVPQNEVDLVLKVQRTVIKAF